jgi:hypothetical protein
MTKYIKTDTLDIKGIVSLGSNNNNDPLIYIKDNTVVFNGDITAVNTNNKSIIHLDSTTSQLFLKTELFSVNGILNIDKNTRSTLLKGYVSTDNFEINNFIQIVPQQVTINSYTNKVRITGSLILLTINCQCIINLITNSDIPINSIIKIVIKTNNTRTKDRLVIINLDKYVIELDDVNDYMEVIIEKDCVTYIGG